MRAVLKPLPTEELDALAGVLARASGAALAEYHASHTTWGLPGEMAALMQDVADAQRTRPRQMVGRAA